MFLQYLSPYILFAESATLEMFQIYKVTMLCRIFTALQILSTVLLVILYWHSIVSEWFSSGMPNLAVLMGIQSLYGCTPFPNSKVWQDFLFMASRFGVAQYFRIGTKRKKTQHPWSFLTENTNIYLFLCFKPKFLVPTGAQQNRNHRPCLNLYEPGFVHPALMKVAMKSPEQAPG